MVVLQSANGKVNTLLLLIKYGVNVLVYDVSNESLSDVYGRNVVITDSLPDDNIRYMTDATRLQHVAMIEKAYRRECNWTSRKDYTIFAQDMMRYDGSKNDVKNVHMMKVYRVFGMRHIHESILSYT